MCRGSGSRPTGKSSARTARGNRNPTCRSLIARYFQDFDLQQYLLHARDGDVVDHLRVEILGDLDNTADLVRVVDVAGDDHAIGRGDDVQAVVGNCDCSSIASSRASGKTITSIVWIFCSSSHKLTWVTPAFFGQQLYLCGRQRRELDDVWIRRLHLRDLLVHRQDAAGVDHHLQALVGALHLVDDGLAPGGFVPAYCQAAARPMTAAVQQRVRRYEVAASWLAAKVECSSVNFLAICRTRSPSLITPPIRRWRISCSEICPVVRSLSLRSFRLFTQGPCGPSSFGGT